MSKSRFAGMNHDHWVQKQQSVARSERVSNDKQFKQFETKPQQTCYNCGITINCKIFKAKKSKNVFSIGGDEGSDCKKWEKRKYKGSSKKEINALLKQYTKKRKL